MDPRPSSRALHNPDRRGESMKEESAPAVGSQIAGIVYTDLVVYILPGALLLFGALVALVTSSDVRDGIGKWIQGMEILGAVFVVAAAAGMSYVTGILISLVRWYIYDPLQGRFNPISLGRLIYGDMPPRSRRAAGLPLMMREKARAQIEKDLKRLGWLDDSSLKTLDDARSGDDLEELRADPGFRLLDCFFSAILESARANHAPIFGYHQRWGDIAALRQNIVIAFQILVLLAAPIAIARDALPAWAIVPAIALVVALGWFYIYVLPSRRYSGMRYVLISYLTGEIQIPVLGTATSSGASGREEAPPEGARAPGAST